MRVSELGHVSLFVRDLDVSTRFYRDVLGLRETGRGKGGRIVFLSAGMGGSAPTETTHSQPALNPRAATLAAVLGGTVAISHATPPIRISATSHFMRGPCHTNPPPPIFR